MMMPQRQPTSQFDTKDSLTFTLQKFQRLIIFKIRQIQDTYIATAAIFCLDF